MWFTRFVLESWNILRESAAYIIVGFLIAGILHVFLARGRWVGWLKGLGAKSVFLASAVGLPLPLCSCSVLPAAVSLRKHGASKGATISFLISTPETSVSSILLTYALLGPIMAVYRPLAAGITAILAGLSVNFAERRFPTPEPAVGDQGAGELPACCDSEKQCRADHALVDDATNSEHPQPASKTSWREGLRHAFVDVFDDVLGWLIIGILVAAAIQVAVPGFVIDAVFGHPLQAMLIMLVIGVPLYVCAEASTPISAVLIAQGVSPGAALVFLLAGPATNIGSVGVLSRQLGRRTVAIYLACIAVVAVVMGLSLDSFFGARGVNLSDRVLTEPILPGWLKTAGAVVFLGLAVGSAGRLRYVERSIALLDRLLPVRVTGRRIAATAAVALILAYAAGGLFIVEPGQLGMVKRFGKVVRADVPPGLHYAIPYPVESVDKIESRQVFRFDIGSLATTAGPAEPADDTVSWFLLGDENIANIKCVTHWHMRPGAVHAFAYATAERRRLVRNAVRAALCRVLGQANIETVFTVEQELLAADIHREAQELLDACDTGIDIMSFGFIDLHAPPEVHDAFREVASALEEKATRRNDALEWQARIVPAAQGAAERITGEAEEYRARILAEATGEATAFLEVLDAFRLFPHLTRARLVYEMYDRVLPGMRKCIKPSGENLYLDLRFGRPAQEQDPAF